MADNIVKYFEHKFNEKNKNIFTCIPRNLCLKTRHEIINYGNKFIANKI